MSERPNVLERLGEEFERVADARLRGVDGTPGALRRATAGRLSMVVVCVLLVACTASPVCALAGVVVRAVAGRAGMLSTSPM